MKPLYLLITVFFLYTFTGHAQKDAPVAGQAAILVDLLKKDYGAINYDLRNDEMVKDRALVISIFKGYLEENVTFVSHTSVDDLAAENANLTNSLKNLNVAKNNLAVFLNTTISLSGTNGKASDISNKTLITNLSKKHDTLATKLEESKKSYYDAHFKVDSIQLDWLKSVYDATQNKFLAKVLEDFKHKFETLHQLGTDRFATVNYTSSVQKSIPFVGGSLSFETFIDGLSRFMVKRIKEELTTYVIEQVQNQLRKPAGADPFTELKILLPVTTEYLLEIHADKITTFPNELKQYIEKDLNHLLSNAVHLRDAPRIKALIAGNPELDFAFEAMEVIPNLTRIKNPVDYFKLLENSRIVNSWQNLSVGSGLTKKNMANLMKLSCLLAQSMTYIDNGELRFTGTDFISGYASENTFQLLLWGFIAQQTKKYYRIDIYLNNTTFNLADKLKDHVKDVNNLGARKNSLTELLINVGIHSEKIAVYAAEIRKSNKTGAKVGADTIYHFAGAMIDLSENLVQSAESLLKVFVSPPAGISLFKDYDSYFRMARASTSMLLDLRQKRYAAALMTGLKLIPPPCNSPQVISLVHFINDMALTENAEDAEQAIEAFALPSGSYSVKRKGVFNASVNAYPGFLPAFDHALGVRKTDSLSGRTSIAFTAPVGLSAAWGTKNGRSIGIFIPVMDIGAVTRFRFSNETSSLPPLKFSTLFSPGIFFHYGFKKSPLSLNIGAQYGPEIRKVEEEKKWESVRFGIGIVLDIPLFNLYNIPRP